MSIPFDALLFLSIGGPEKPEEIRPFLDNILGQSKAGIPEKRLEAVAGRYMEIGGCSPANSEIRRMISSLESLLSTDGPDIPVYMANLFSRPYLPDTIEEMISGGIKNALALATSPFGSDFSCWRYRKAIREALDPYGSRSLRIKKLRLFFNHPDFIAAQAARLEEAIGEAGLDRHTTPLVFTAHSLPTQYASTSIYEDQVRETCSLAAEQAGCPSWDLAFQSRSGPPSQPWLEPHPSELLRKHAEQGVGEVLVSPIGFMYDNLEVIYDLDREMGQLADELGIRMVRVKTTGSHPGIIRMARKLILEQTSPGQEKESIGRLGLPDDDCLDCSCLKQ